MPELGPVICPDCGRSVGPVLFIPDYRGGPPTARAYGACLRRCETCGVGFSNAQDPARVVMIHRDPLRNIPAEVADGAREALAAALNERNRANKLEKFGF